MAKGINKAIIIGTLGKDPEIKYTAAGKAIANVSVATNESWKDKNTGEQVEKAEWHRIVMFDKIAEISGKYLKKGAMAYFEGKLQTRKWQDNSGSDRYTTEIVATQMQMLGGKVEGDYQRPQQQAPSGPPGSGVDQDGFDDIPF